MAQYDHITYEVRTCTEDSKSCVITMRVPYDGNPKSLGTWRGLPAWNRIMGANLEATRGLFHALQMRLVVKILDAVVPKVLLALFEDELPPTTRDLN